MEYFRLKLIYSFLSLVCKQDPITLEMSMGENNRVLRNIL